MFIIKINGISRDGTLFATMYVSISSPFILVIIFAYGLPEKFFPYFDMSNFSRNLLFINIDHVSRSRNPWIHFHYFVYFTVITLDSHFSFDWRKAKNYSFKHNSS